MRLCAPVYDYSTPEEWIARHRENGYGAAYWPLPDGAPEEQIQAYASAAKEAGLVIAEIGIWNNMLDPDPEKKEANIQYAIRRLALAERLGVTCCVNTSGARSEVWDGPHPDNLTEETFRELVAIVRRIIDAVNPKIASFTLEPRPWMYPTTADDLQRLIDEVDRPQFKVHVDMCNIINSYEKTLKTGELTRDFFARFKDRIVCIHAKDTLVSPHHLTLHIDEAIPGDGVFDYDALLTEAAKLDPDIPFVSEHLSRKEEYEESTSFMKKKAAELGLAFVTI